MSHHINNTLRFIGSYEDVNEILSLIKFERKGDQDFYIDFDKIIPAPPEFNIKETDSTAKVRSLLFGSQKASAEPSIEGIQKWYSELEEEKQKEYFLLALEYEKGLKKYNHQTRYEWIIENWGTRWAYIYNYDHESSPDVIEFKSCNAPPFPIIIELSKRFPKVLFELRHDFPGYEDKHCTVKYRKGKTVSEVCVWKGVLREEEEEGEDEWIDDYYRPYVEDEVIDKTPSNKF